MTSEAIAKTAAAGQTRARGPLEERGLKGDKAND
jgi:hypothetical protein